MDYVGLDVHLRSSTVHVLDDTGRDVLSNTIRGHWLDVVSWLKTYRRPFAICYEASFGYGPLYDALSRVAKRVAVAHPGNLRLIFRSKQKNDRVDARKLANSCSWTKCQRCTFQVLRYEAGES